MKHSITILIGGVAGQGLLTSGQILSRALVRSGCHIVVTQNYMSRIRGGHNSFAIRASAEPVIAPRETIDLLIALDARSVAEHSRSLNPGGIIIVDEAEQVETGAWQSLRVPAAALGKPSLFNIMACGAAGALVGLGDEQLADALDREWRDGGEEARAALTAAAAWARRAGVVRPLSPTRATAPRIMVNGNEALALGAIAGGIRFASFYPMTPGTSVILTLLAHADRMGLIVEQAEDEIAAVNMSLGASFAGAPSLVATSGGGFALMAEGVSLSGMTETPVVIIVAQRPGPATGLPTRTEQGDLEFVLHAGHGEFPRAILTPGSPRQCFEQAARAVELAELSQGPVFILTDQFLADSYRGEEPFEPSAVPTVRPLDLSPPEEPGYRRYALTESGVSPRAIPGFSGNLVVADSDEHTEDGHITEDLAVREAMVKKRLRKLDILRREFCAPSYVGPDEPDLLLVCWGSTWGAVVEAAEELAEGGVRTAVLHFSQVWPLVEDTFLPRLENARRVVAIEGNATGQFARLLRRECGFSVQGRVNRWDGLPLTPEYIKEKLADAGLV